VHSVDSSPDNGQSTIRIDNDKDNAKRIKSPNLIHMITLRHSGVALVPGGIDNQGQIGWMWIAHALFCSKHFSMVLAVMTNT